MSASAFLSPAQKQQLMIDAEDLKVNWLQAVQDLLAEVTEWSSDQPEWNVEQSEIEITEEALGGTYLAPVLEITTSKGRVILEPIARAVIGAQGRIDLYAWPSLYRLMLLKTREEKWMVRTDSGVNWPSPWRKDTFLDLVDRLLQAV